MFIAWPDFWAWQDDPMEFSCNATSACRVLPFDALFAILDCAPQSYLEDLKKHKDNTI